MKKIKKLGITALAAVLVVSAAGCGKKEEKVYKNSDIVMSVKLVHSENAKAPMLLTPSGMLMLVKPVQL